MSQSHKTHTIFNGTSLILWHQLCTQNMNEIMHSQNFFWMKKLMDTFKAISISGRMNELQMILWLIVGFPLKSFSVSYRYFFFILDHYFVFHAENGFGRKELERICNTYLVHFYLILYIHLHKRCSSHHCDIIIVQMCLEWKCHISEVCIYHAPRLCLAMMQNCENLYCCECHFFTLAVIVFVQS